MDFFNTVSIEQAKAEIRKRAEKYSISCECIDILSANGRVAYEDVKSREIVPAFTRSTVDGYAVNSKDSHGASSTIPSLLNLVERIEMGKEPERAIISGEASYVPTGGMLPEGADAVVMIESAEELDESTLMIYKAVSNGDNVLKRGDDIDGDTVLIPKGRIISSYDIGVLSSQGISKVRVYRKLKFTILSTGDEIIDVDEDIKMGQIRDINSYVIASEIMDMGHEVVKRTIVKDDYDELKKEMEEGIEQSDIVLISGGSSVGTKDYTCDVIKDIGGQDVFIHGISVKPGKPTIVGEANGKLIFGLPGQPASSIVIFSIIVKTAIRDVLGIDDDARTAQCIMDTNFPSASGKTTYQMVKVYEREGKLYASPIFGKSGMISLLSKADGYIEIGADEEGINRGDTRRITYL